ncbi:MAG: CatB-related O-acetyltransferase [bacterium]
MNGNELQAQWRRMNAHNETYLTRIFDLSKVSVGKKTYGPLDVHTFGHPQEKLTIGNYVSIASGVTFLLGGNHPYEGFSTFPFLVKNFGYKEEAATKGPIIVKDDVWIGLNSIILSGVTIGKGCIIAAGTVVTKNVPDYTILGGNPAKILKYRFEEEIRKELARIDFSLLDDETIAQNREILYEKLTKENVKEIVDRLVAKQQINNV